MALDLRSETRPKTVEWLPIVNELEEEVDEKRRFVEAFLIAREAITSVREGKKHCNCKNGGIERETEKERKYVLN